MAIGETIVPVAIKSCFEKNPLVNVEKSSQPIPIPPPPPPPPPTHTYTQQPMHCMNTPHIHTLTKCALNGNHCYRESIVGYTIPTYSVLHVDKPNYWGWGGGGGQNFAEAASVERTPIKCISQESAKWRCPKI